MSVSDIIGLSILAFVYLYGVRWGIRVLWDNRHALLTTRSDLIFIVPIIIPVMNLLVLASMENSGWKAKYRPCRICRAWRKFWDAPINWS